MNKMKVIPVVKNKQGKIMVLRNYTYLTFLPNSYSTSKKTHPFFNNRIVVLFSISKKEHLKIVYFYHLL